MNKKDITITKELEPIKTQVSKATSFANSLVIKTGEQMLDATDLLGKIKKVGKMIKDKKELLTKPLNEALKNARDMFRPLEEQWSEAERIVKNKMVDYQIDQDQKAQKKEEKILDKMQKGKISDSEALEQIKAVEPVNQVKAESGSVQFRTVKEIVIENMELIPREYMIPDMARIKRLMLAGVKVEGVKIEERKIVAGSGY